MTSDVNHEAFSLKAWNLVVDTVFGFQCFLSLV